MQARDVQNILVCCVDGLSGFCDAITSVYPQTDIHRCIIHQIHSSTRFVVSKDIKSFVSDLKKIYNANTQDEAWEQLMHGAREKGQRGGFERTSVREVPDS